MKSLLNLFSVAILASFLLISCGDAETKSEEGEKKEEVKEESTNAENQAPGDVARDGRGRMDAVEGDHNTSHYVCPERHEGSGSTEKGQCPTCGKNYVHNEKSLFHEKQKELQRTIQDMTPEEADEYQKSFQSEEKKY